MGVRGRGSASADFRDSVAEIGRATNSSIGDWRFPDFLISDKDFAAPEDFVITDDEISKASVVSAKGNSVISDDGIADESCG